MINHSEYYQKLNLGRHRKFKLYINGAFREPRSKEYFEVRDPSNGEVLGLVPLASKEDIDEAVESSRMGFKAWLGLNPSQRKNILYKISQIAKKHADDFALIESLNVGVPLSLTRRFSASALSKNFEYYAQWADKIYGDVVPLSDNNFDYTQKEPIGCVGAITSWNTPTLFIGSKVAPALATGNSVIIKPSEKAPLPALKFAELLQEVDLPKGLINVITGMADTGTYMCIHPGIDGISFTGGTDIGKHIMAQSASTLKKLSLELGGKSPLIVFKDADLDKAVMMSCFGVFGLTGQMCIASSRIFVENDIFKDFVRRFSEFAEGMKIGDPIEPATLVGPLVSESHINRVMKFIEDGKTFGKCLFGGNRIEGDDLENGYFVELTGFTDMSDSCKPYQEEIFGPVAIITGFNAEDNAVEFANNTRYGLAAGIFTKDISRAHRLAKQIKAGQIWINTYSTLPYTAPFGGMKQSGFGKEGGKEALDSFISIKNVYVDLN